MTEPGPHFQQLSDDLDQTWRSAAAAKLAAEITELSQTNRSQSSLANRLAVCCEVVELSLITGETLSGQVLLVGTDAILLRTAAKKLLLPISSIVTVIGLGKSKSLNRPNRAIMHPVLLRQIQQNVTAVTTSNDLLVGTMVAVWADVVDLQLTKQRIAIAISTIVKWELS